MAGRTGGLQCDWDCWKESTCGADTKDTGCRAAAGNLITGCMVRICSVDIADVPLDPLPRVSHSAPRSYMARGSGFRPGSRRLLEGKDLWMLEKQRAYQQLFQGIMEV